MSPKTKAVILIVVAVAILAGIILYASLKGGQPSPGTASAPSSAAPGTPAFAPKGELVAGFPQGLILDGNAAISGSYSINYSSSTNQYTAAWDSSSSMGSLYDAYKAYLPAHGWTIVNDITKFRTSRGLYAKNATSEVSISIMEAGAGTQVSITFISFQNSPSPQSGVSIINTEHSTSTPQNIGRYFDLSGMQIEDAQVRTLSDGSLQSIVGFKSNSLENIRTLALDAFAKNGFTVQVDEEDSSSISLSAINGSERLQVAGFVSSGNSSSSAGMNDSVTIIDVAK